jgi:hypothetical protein
MYDALILCFCAEFSNIVMRLLYQMRFVLYNHKSSSHTHPATGFHPYFLISCFSAACPLSRDFTVALAAILDAQACLLVLCSSFGGHNLPYLKCLSILNNDKRAAHDL